MMRRYQGVDATVAVARDWPHLLQNFRTGSFPSPH